jgi:hypothetical protein
MPGVPCIYYGSEWGVKGMRTRESDYDLRPCLDINNIPDPNYKLYEHICRLGKIRKALPALQIGDFENINIRNEQLVYKRKCGNQCVYVALNLSQNPYEIDFNCESAGCLSDVLTGENFNTDGYARIPLEPYSSRIMVLGDGSINISSDSEEKVEPIKQKKTKLTPEPVTPGKYRHFKGGEYEVIGIAKDCETEKEVVVYKALYGERQLWVRDKDNFEEIVERDGQKFRRFTRID